MVPTPSNAVAGASLDRVVEAPERVIATGGGEGEPQPGPSPEHVGDRVDREAEPDPLARHKRDSIFGHEGVVDLEIVAVVAVLGAVHRAVPTTLHPLFEPVRTQLSQGGLHSSVLGPWEEP